MATSRNDCFRINIVAPLYQGWILRQIAINFKRHIHSATLSDKPDPKAEVNFYINQYLFSGRTRCDIGFFTHREKQEPLASRFDDLACKMDGCVAMCEKTAALLPREKTTVIKVGPDKRFLGRDLVLGVVGKEHGTGRKRYSWIPEIRKIPGVKVVCTNGQIPLRSIPAFYRKIDYLLILSDNEGGPIPLLEALGMGVPVISSDVGFVSDYSTLRYETLEDLIALVKGLVVPNDIWLAASNNLVDFCQRISALTPIRDAETTIISSTNSKRTFFEVVRHQIWTLLPFGIQNNILDFLQNRRVRGGKSV